ncbi:MAG TPA: hypothetical protein VKQ72_06440 [Aggregatilineales bacterium]|nr:hypothetical protein [Aggregatilineales bacterium]
MTQPENDPTAAYGVALRTRIIGVCGLILGAMILHEQSVGFNTGTVCLDMPLFVIALIFLLAGAVFLFYQARLTVDDSRVSYSLFGRRSEIAWAEVEHAVLNTSKNVGLKNQILMVFGKTDKAKPTIEANIALLKSRKEIVEQLQRRLGGLFREE